VKVTRKQIVTALEMTEDRDPGKLTLSKGLFTFRKGYFYRHGRTAEDVFVNTLQRLSDQGFKVSNVEYGDHWAAFDGGAGVRKTSHWWMTCKIEEKTTDYVVVCGDGYVAIAA
jgi:hypothetical protein